MYLLGYLYSEEVYKLRTLYSLQKITGKAAFTLGKFNRINLMRINFNSHWRVHTRH